MESRDRVLVMGILNVTPDSFFDGGHWLDPENALQRAKLMVAEGADILDIGGESTRPGAKRISPEQEMGRVLPVIERISRSMQCPISVDTMRACVAQEGVQHAGSVTCRCRDRQRRERDACRSANGGCLCQERRVRHPHAHARNAADDAGVSHV